VAYSCQVGWKSLTLDDLENRYALLFTNRQSHIGFEMK